MDNNAIIDQNINAQPNPLPEPFPKQSPEEMIPPEPTQTTVAPPVLPEESQPSSKKSKILLYGIIGLVILIILGMGIFVIMNKSSNGNGSGILIGKQSEEDILNAQFQIDSDKDAIPDSVEIAISLDPQVSEFIRCQTNNCDLSGKNTASIVNTLIILDSSGSMATNIGGGSKMDLAKTAIKNFISTISNTENVGLMVYGHKGSNSQSDKTTSCASADIIAPLGSFKSTTVDGYLEQINPVGWTPIGLAIEKGLAAFSGKEGQTNQMIIISDGVETCDSNPVTKAAQAYASALKIKINVIGFAVDINDQNSLSDISTSGGGTFVSANSSSELEAQFEANHKNVDNYISDTTCIYETSNTTYECLSSVQDKIWNYFDPLISSNVSNGKLYNLYSNTNSIINKTYSDKINEIQNTATDQFDERRDTLLDQ